MYTRRILAGLLLLGGGVMFACASLAATLFPSLSSLDGVGSLFQFFRQHPDITALGWLISNLLFLVWAASGARRSVVRSIDVAATLDLRAASVRLDSLSALLRVKPEHVEIEYNTEALQLAPPPGRAADQRRHFAVSLDGGPLKPGRTVYVNCSLNLEVPDKPAVATAPADLDTSIPVVSFTCSVEGFECVSPASLPVEFTAERDTKPVIFMLRVLDAEVRRITISAYQDGVIRGQVVVDDPASLLAAPDAGSGGSNLLGMPQGALQGRFDRVSIAPSMSLDILGPSTNIIGNSPHDCLDWSAKDLGPWRSDAADVMAAICSHIAGLYAAPPAPDDIDREFTLLGKRIAGVLPEKLVTAMETKPLVLASIQVPRSFDFPIDLCWVAGRHLQDTIPTARWFTNARAVRLNRTHRVSNIALVVGKMKQDSKVEESALAWLKPATFKQIRTRKQLIDLVFRTSDFELLHYFGHCGRGQETGPQAGRFLSLADDSKTFRLSELGLLDEEREFFRAAPLIVLNCCEGTGASGLFDGIESFPHRFIENDSVAFVGALWPIDSRAANRFVSAFYDRLSRSSYVAHALHETRKQILSEARAPGTAASERLFLTLAARAYVYYGPPDLRCAFS
jgi:hypothetical protein